MLQEKINQAETPEVAAGLAEVFLKQVGINNFSKKWEDWELVMMPDKVVQPNGKNAFLPKDLALRYKKTQEEDKEVLLSFRLLGIVKVTKVA